MNVVNAVNKAEIAMMHAVLSKKFGQLYADIWKVGVNLSLRISDLLILKYADLNLDERSLKLTEAKTGKLKTIRLNSAAIGVIARRQQENPADTGLNNQKNHLSCDPS
jgi:integrase